MRWTLLLLTVMACGLDLSILNLPPAVDAVRVTPADTTVPVGSRFRFAVALQDESGKPLSGRLVGWSTDAPGVVRVDTSGQVYALAPGTAVVTARSEGREGTATVVVLYEPVASVLVLPQTAVLATGQERQFRADVRDGQGFASVDPVVAWRTTDTLLATVDSTGLVRSRAPGRVAVIVEAAGHADTAALTILVPLASVTVTPGDTTLAYGGVLQLNAILRDSAGNTLSDRPVTWTTSDSGVAAISPTGRASLIGPGSATVTATATGTTGSANIVVQPLALRTVAAGWRHSCGLTDQGAAFCWGAGDHGAVGTGSLDPIVRRPVPVATDLRFASITAGGDHSCALTDQGAAYCWGANTQGQLGAVTGNACGLSCAPTPVAVQGGLVFVSLAAGWNDTCGLTGNGDAYCWGSNDFGKLGHWFNGGSMPQMVEGGVVFQRIAPGTLHTCGLGTGGTVYCWGTFSGGSLPTPVSADSTFTTIAVGDSTACALAPGGTPYCWRANWVLDSGVIHVSAPAAVAGVALADISLGAGDFCGVTADGRGYCWGLNDVGQLGDGTTHPRNTPVEVSGPTSFTAIRSGGQHTCGLGGDALVYCWGGNLRGQVGRTGAPSYAVPVVIDGQR